MTDVFISYKREDEARVVRLVRALERRGFSVWWDRGLPGGEGWRREIETALAAARCVVVVWTHGSVGPGGDFVRDEAARAKARGVLVPVMLDQVPLPLGFGELQAIDLTHWKSSPRDPFVGDLAATISARLENRPPPPATAPTKRLVRRIAYSSAATLLTTAAAAFALNAFDIQDRLCGQSMVQPAASDVCGAIGIGHRPTRAERVAWDGRAPGSCDAIRAHIAAFPEGAYRQRAAAIVAARRVTEVEDWQPATRRLALFVGQDRVFPGEAAARADTLARAGAAAERLCRGFAATGSFRLTAANAQADEWQCERAGRGIACGFQGEAVCVLQERIVTPSEVCGE